MKSIFLCMLSLYIISFLAGAEFYIYLSTSEWQSQMHGNTMHGRIRGLAFYDFGRGIISSSDCRAILIEDNSNHSRILIRDEATIATLKQWILEKDLMHNGVCGPVYPMQTKLDDQININLYASDNVNDPSNLLISIPLTPLLTNAYDNTDEYVHTRNEFRSLFGLE